MSKDVIIAGSVAVCCIALIAVAVFAPKSKSEPSTEPPKVDISLADGTQPTDVNGTPGVPLTTDHPLAPGVSGSIGSTTAPGMQPMPPLSGTGNSTTAPVTVAPWNSQGQINGNDLSGNLAIPAPVPVEAPPTQAKEQKIHVVANGELLGDIALHYYGSSKQWRRIVEANPGLSPNHVKVGQKLVIPAVDKTPAPTTSGTNAPGGERTYTVKKNDGYHSIAARELGSASRWKEIEKLNGVPSTELKIGQVIKLPPATTSPAPTSGNDALPTPAGTKTHTVAAGEHLADIAKKYYGKKSGKAEWKKIVSANPGINPDHLKVGQKLTIPDVAGAAPVQTPVPAPEANAPVAEGTEYTIQKGDTPQVIAKRELGAKASKKDVDVLVKSIVALNPGINPTNLRIGQKIKLPAKGGSAPVVPTPAPAIPPVAPAVPGGFGAPTTPGAFGAPVAPGGTNGFAPSTPDPAFGAPVTPATTAPAPGASPFGTAPASGFGAPTTGASDFASPYANSNQGFGAPAPVAPAAGPTSIR